MTTRWLLPAATCCWGESWLSFLGVTAASYCHLCSCVLKTCGAVASNTGSAQAALRDQLNVGISVWERTECAGFVWAIVFLMYCVSVLWVRQWQRMKCFSFYLHFSSSGSYYPTLSSTGINHYKGNSGLLWAEISGINGSWLVAQKRRLLS